MNSPAEFRKEAEEYIRQAENLTQGARIRLLEMAQSCLQLADQTEWFDAQSQAIGTAPHRAESP